MEEEIEKRKSKLNKFFFGWIKDNYDKIFFVLLILAFLLRLWIFFKTMNQPVWWDGADYLSTAKRWGLGLNIQDIWYYRRGFLFPLIGALFFKLGLGEIGIRFLIVVCSTGIIAVSYFLISKMFNKKLALLTTLALSVSWIILFFTGRILTDIPTAFLLLLSAFFFWKGYVLKEGNKFLYLFGLIFALAVLTRMQALMLAPAFIIYIFINEKMKAFKNKHLWITCGIFFLILLPHFVLYAMHYGNPLLDILSYYLKIGDSGATAQRSLEIFKYFTDLPYMLSTPVLVAFFIGIFYFLGDLFLGLDKVAKSQELKNKLFVFLWIFFLFLLMGYVGAHSYVEQRYITAGLPFLFLIAVSSLVFIENLFVKHFHLNEKVSLVIVFIILILLIVPNLLLATSMIEAKKNSYIEVKEAGELMKANSNPGDVIMSTSLPQITYYSERSTYPYDVMNYSLHQGEKEVKYSDGEKGFKEFLLNKKPKFLMVSSAFEEYPEWMLIKGNQNGINYVIMPFFNSSLSYNLETKQLTSIDLKQEVKKDGMTLKLFYPGQNGNLNGIFIYKVEYD
ncbi:MAG: glycosyltransferase family 39 protein [Nanoarchaeota archaeon]